MKHEDVFDNSGDFLVNPYNTDYILISPFSTIFWFYTIISFIHFVKTPTTKPVGIYSRVNPHKKNIIYPPRNICTCTSLTLMRLLLFTFIFMLDWCNYSVSRLWRSYHSTVSLTSLSSRLQEPKTTWLPPRTRNQLYGNIKLARECISACSSCMMQ